MRKPMLEPVHPPYKFILKNTTLKTARSTGLLLAVLAIIILLTRYFGYGGSILNVIAAVAVFFWTSLLLFRRRRNHNLSYFPAFLITGLALLFIPPIHFTGLFYLLLTFVERFAYKPETVLFNDQGILLKNGLSTRTYNWDEFSNILLKDGLLTLDFRNNRLLQKETLESSGFREEDFNRFCLLKLTK